jgi:hypothetical protein
MKAGHNFGQETCLACYSDSIMTGFGADAVISVTRNTKSSGVRSRLHLISSVRIRGAVRSLPHTPWFCVWFSTRAVSSLPVKNVLTVQCGLICPWICAVDIRASYTAKCVRPIAATYRLITLQRTACKFFSAGAYRMITLQGTIHTCVSAGTYTMITLQGTVCKCVSAGTYRMITLQGKICSCSIISCHMGSVINAYSPVLFFPFNHSKYSGYYTYHMP